MRMPHRNLALCALLLALLHGPTTVAKTAAPAYEAGTVPLPEGGQLAYYERKASGPALVLIPGSWGDYRVFDAMVAALAPEWRLIIVELRGHGGSWPPTMNSSIELFAEDVLRVTDALGLKQFFVGGHSIGGMIPIEMAKQRPGVLAGVIAIEGWSHHKVQGEAFGKLPPFKNTPEQEKMLREARARVQDRLSQEQIDNFASAWKKWDGQPILETTEVPVLEIWGDRGAGPQPLELMRIPNRPNIEVLWIPGASHALLVEKPEAVAQAVNRWIKNRLTPAK